MNDTASVIARNWYKTCDLIHLDVDFGEAMTYDILQIINRSILTERQKQEVIGHQKELLTPEEVLEKVEDNARQPVSSS